MGNINMLHFNIKKKDFTLYNYIFLKCFLIFVYKFLINIRDKYAFSNKYKRKLTFILKNVDKIRKIIFIVLKTIKRDFAQKDTGDSTIGSTMKRTKGD